MSSRLALSLAFAISCQRAAPPPEQAPAAPAPIRVDASGAVTAPRVAIDAGGVLAAPTVAIDAGTSATDAPSDARFPTPPPTGRAIDLGRVPPGHGWWCYASRTGRCHRTRAACERALSDVLDEGAQAEPCEVREAAYCTTYLNGEGRPSARCTEDEASCNDGPRRLAFVINSASAERGFAIRIREISDCAVVP